MKLSSFSDSNGKPSTQPFLLGHVANHALQDFITSASVLVHFNLGCLLVVSLMLLSLKSHLDHMGIMYKCADVLGMLEDK